MLRCYAILAALVLVGLTTFDARADRRVAFVIGNSEYRDIPALKNPDKDADDVSNTFRQAGFDVFLAKDVTRLQFEEQFRNYLAAADGADLAVVYYSGHGFQIGGENFLIPVDASLKNAAGESIRTVGDPSNDRTRSAAASMSRLGPPPPSPYPNSSSEVVPRPFSRYCRSARATSRPEIVAL